VDGGLLCRIASHFHSMYCEILIWQCCINAVSSLCFSSWNSMFIWTIYESCNMPNNVCRSTFGHPKHLQRALPNEGKLTREYATAERLNLAQYKTSVTAEDPRGRIHHNTIKLWNFVPTYFRSQERKYHLNFRSLELSLPVAKVTWNFCFQHEM